MSLVSEDGTGLANAEAYITVAEADTHLANRGFTLWATMSTTEKEWAIRRATDYMVQAYRGRWAGARLTLTQALDWPRIYVPVQDWDAFSGSVYYASNVVPPEIKRASADLSFKAAGGELTPTLERKTVRERVDVIEVEYDRNSPQFPVYKAIDDTLTAFFKAASSSLNRPVVRV